MRVNDTYARRLVGQSSTSVPWPVYPVYASENECSFIDEYFRIMLSVSSEIWQKHEKGIGFLRPWHDEYIDTDTRQYNVAKMKEADWYDEEMLKFLRVIHDWGVSFRVYCYFTCFYSDYSNWETVEGLYYRPQCRNWTHKVFEYVKESNEYLDKVVGFLSMYMDMHVEKCGYGAIVNPNSLLETDKKWKKGTAKKFGLYHRIADRIYFFEKKDIDQALWMSQKFDNIIKAFKDNKYVHLKTIVNRNSFDPSFDEIKEIANDEWREIRTFLSLSIDCDFPDGMIPVGWKPAADDFDDKNKIVSIDKDGYYYYSDGTQRRGNRHYFSNKYLALGCTPENFEKFKNSWDKKSLVMSTPTWEDYEKYAVYPGKWDMEGEPTNGRGKSVKWRKR